MLLVAVLCVAAAPAAVGIYKATLEEPGQRTREISTDEMRRVLRDSSVTILDARLPMSLVQKGGASEIRHAIDDGRLPIEDRGTRIFVLGEDGASAKLVAEAIAREAFHDVSFFDGSFAQASAAPGG